MTFERRHKILFRGPCREARARELLTALPKGSAERVTEGRELLDGQPERIGAVLLRRVRVIFKEAASA